MKCRLSNRLEFTLGIILTQGSDVPVTYIASPSMPYTIIDSTFDTHELPMLNVKAGSLDISDCQLSHKTDHYK